MGGSLRRRIGSPIFCEECGYPALRAAVSDAINAASPLLVQLGAALDAAPSVSAE